MNADGSLIESVSRGDPAKALLAMVVIAAGWALLELVMKHWRP